MYLKKLEVQGFKSFPEYTLVEFDRGMTAVVGPNGSGKSNVTDAIRWVLGEQSVKSLRGGKMEDVIFNGTQSRKAMNYAEVSMTLDNSDHYLDYDYNEIQITRRLYRSGESEYQINHVNCRLKDIVALFLDTGLGKDGYSIVGQGKVDEILSTKSEDRRRVLEEASGIVKYKVRKDEAERKLNSTEQNLVRIDDILTELSERIEPLRIQSEKAVEYHKTYEELKKNDISLLVYRIKKANESMGDQGDLKSKLEEDLRINEDRYLAMRNSNSDLVSRSEKLENDIEDRRQELSDLTEEIYNISSDKKITNVQLEQIETKLDDYIEEENKLLEDIERLGEERKQKLQIASDLLEAANQKKKEADSLSVQRDELIEKFNDSSSNREDIRQEIDHKTQELISCKESINMYDVKIKSFDERINELSSRRVSYIDTQKELSTLLETSDSNFKSLMQQEAEVISDIDSRNIRLNEIKTKNTELLKDYDDLSHQSASLSSRIKVLSDLERKKEGYQESVRRLVNFVESNSSYSKRIVGILGDLISVESTYETAIEIALGNSIHNVVTQSEDDASVLIDVLKKERLGRVTFLPIENIKPRELESDFRRIASSQQGYIGIASELTTQDSIIDNIVSNLLGRIVVCDTLDNARVIANKLKHQVKIITLQGDSINPGGSLTGGSIHKNSVGILGRTREIEDLTQKNALLITKLSNLESERQRIDDEIGTIELEIEQLGEQLKYYSVERAKAETTYSNLKERNSDIERLVSETIETIESVSRERLKSIDDMQEMKLVLEEAEQELDELRKSILESDSTTSSYSRDLDEIKEAISVAVASAQQIIAERNGVLQLAEVLERESNSHLEALEMKKNENKQDLIEKEELNKKITSYTSCLDEMNTSANKLDSKIKALSQERAELEKELSGFLDKLTDCSDTINSIKNQLNLLTSKYERYIEEIDSSKNRLWEDYETTYDNVVDDCIVITNVTETTQLISSLKSKIKSIGPVNLNSVDEYKEISDRFDFMTSQRNDIYEAKTNLEKVIADLLDEMRNQFIEHFNTINENFKTVFEDLFNGGTAEITLDGDDVLNCNIEIKAQPPGKKLQSLTLLSGGERCLTAIALLFAILQLRPSPFVILDEVEAALDDVNVSRFTDFVRRYCVRSQFIVVTHRKGTMEACDRMYGVTMQERGISKILSMRLGDS